MELKLNYDEIPGPIMVERVSDKKVRITGSISLILVKKEISTTLTIERVGYSSLTFSCPDSNLIRMALKMIPGKYKKAVSVEDDNIKINFREIPELEKVAEIMKLTGISFKETGIYVSATQR